MTGHLQLSVCPRKMEVFVRICGDFKVSVNQVLLDNPYPLPDTEDIFATLGSGTVFSKIDCEMHKNRWN